jgi:PAS domain S-box-containing protein
MEHLLATLEKALEKQRAVRALAQSEARYRGLFDGVPVGLYRSTPEGQFIEVNPTLVTLLGYPDRETLLATSAIELHVDAEDRRRWQGATEQGSLLENYQVRWRRWDGSTVWVESSDRAVRDATGRVRYYEGVVTDITERKEAEKARTKLEAQLRQAQKMEAVGRLAGGVAHDFNNLLTVILGRAAILEHHLGSDARLQRNAALVVQTAERAAGLTQQLLAFSRQQVVQPQVLDLNAIVTGTERMLRRLLGEDVELISVLAPDLGRVKADAGQIEQVIMNLVVNARDAMPQGGRLVLETANVELDETYARQHPGSRAGRHAMLSVADTGSGMDRETQAQIFEPFFTTKEVGRGTGLGLSTVFGIVKQSEGSVFVYSEVGVGSTFKVYLPCVEESATVATPELPVGAPRGGSETILLVEDEESLRELARETLGGLGYTVLVATHGVEALDIGDRHEGALDLLLTDVIMPQLSGPELAGQLGRRRPGLRVLFMSGYTGTLLGQSRRLDPGVTLLEKPFTPDALARKVRDVLDG